ncbi:unnamed protein product, partial [Didymodactylos carnosus]
LSIINTTSQRKFEWSSSYYNRSYPVLSGDVHELFDFNNVEHNQSFNKNQQILFEEFRLAKTDTSPVLTPISASKTDHKRSKRDTQLNTSIPITTAVISTTKTTTITSLHTSQLVQHSNLTQTTSVYNLSPITTGDDAAERWSNLLSMQDEELIPVDVLSRQLLFDVDTTMDGSGECKNFYIFSRNHIINKPDVYLRYHYPFQTMRHVFF